MTTTQARAKVGGEIGTNGEFYEGGKFLPSTQKAKGAPKKRTGPSKVEIEPYVWVPAQEGKNSIYSMLAGTFVRFAGKQMEPFGSEETVRRFHGDPQKIQRLVDMYNAGERFADFGPQIDR